MRVVFTTHANPRALPPATLGSLAAQLGFAGATVLERDPRRALARARELAGPTGTVVATGSIYLVADLLSRARQAESEHPVNRDDGPSVLAMIGFVAAVVAVVILVFFAIGYAFGRAFL